MVCKLLGMVLLHLQLLLVLLRQEFGHICLSSLFHFQLHSFVIHVSFGLFKHHLSFVLEIVQLHIFVEFVQLLGQARIVHKHFLSQVFGHFVLLVFVPNEVALVNVGLGIVVYPLFSFFPPSHSFSGAMD